VTVASLRASWERLWFAPEHARNLAGVRIAIATHALWIVLSRDYAATSGLPPEFWARVSDAVRWRFLTFPGLETLERWLAILAVLALLAVLIGWRARPAALVAGVLLYHLAPLETIIWTPSPYERGLEVSVLALIVLSAAPCADAWGVDARRRFHGAVPGPASDYRWPLVLIQLFVAQIYFFSGWSKLVRVGVDWLSAANRRAWLLLFNQYDEVAVFTTVGPWLADHAWLCGLLAVGSVALDLGFITVVASRLWRRILVPLAVLFHAGILVSMNIAFLNAPQLLVFINWHWLGARLSAPRGANGQSKLTPA